MYKPSTGAGLLTGQDVQTASPRVVAVFAADPDEARRTVLHVRKGATGLPVWLYCTRSPSRDVAQLCDRVVVDDAPLRLLKAAQRDLWPRRAALSAGTWTGHGSGVLRLAPLLVPPFRAVFLNRSGDFLPGTPGKIAAHILHGLRERAHDVRVRGGEIGGDLWALVRYHIWRSAPVTRVKDHVSAAGLLAVATLLRACGYPQRKLFPKIHGNGALHVPELRESEGEGIVCFHQHDHHWDAKAIAEAAAGGARWMVWHNGGGPGAVKDLLPLFRDEATFAVSRQASYRAWKPAILPTAPFRTLQPEERTQLLAPLGSSIVVDARKLLALGVPEVSHPITAWMLIYWKAAAAGWKSYCAGQAKALEPEPDYPSAEAAFLLEVARDRELRALGPREATLARGNIAFAPGMAEGETADTGRPRVLVISPFLPYPLSHGGAVRIYNLCRALRDRVDFALIAVRENRETVDYAKLGEIFREVRVVDIDCTEGAEDELPEQVRQHRSPTLRQAIASMCREWRPDIVQFEYTQIAGLKEAAGEIPAILVEHDITQSLYGQLAAAEPSRKSRREHGRWRSFENRWLARYEGVWTVSEADRALAVEYGGRERARTYAIANGVDTDRFVPAAEPEGELEILYVGSFRHRPNILAFERLRTAVLPAVWARHPETRLRVVAGPRHQYFWERFQAKTQLSACDARITIHDFVDDLRPLYARASVVAVPLEVSAGTNIKVMEAMACGRAIVSTPTGCAGLELEDGRDLLVRRDASEFAAAVCELLERPELRRDIARRARATVEARFSWKAIADGALRSYRDFIPPK